MINLIVTIIGAIAASLALWYVILDHQPKPQLEVVFTNGTTNIDISGNDLGDGTEHIAVTLMLRNQGTRDATSVAAHLVINEDLANHYNGSDFDFTSVPGFPQTYDALKLKDRVVRRAPYALGVLDLALKPGTYSIATEIDCHECDYEASATLTITVEKNPEANPTQ